MINNDYSNITRTLARMQTEHYGLTHEVEVLRSQNEELRAQIKALKTLHDEYCAMSADVACLRNVIAEIRTLAENT